MRLVISQNCYFSRVKLILLNLLLNFSLVIMALWRDYIIYLFSPSSLALTLSFFQRQNKAWWFKMEITVMCINLTNKLHISVRVYCNRSQTTLERVKNKKVRHKTKSSGATVILYTLWRLLWSITVHTHARTERCNLFVLQKNKSEQVFDCADGLKKALRNYGYNHLWV